MDFPTLKDPRRVLALVGVSRHSGLPVLRERVEATARPIVQRIAALLVGSTLIGTAVALLVQADLGLPPYDVLSSGLGGRFGVTLGQAGWIVAGVLFIVASGLGHRPSLWGIAYILANGAAVDATAHLLNEPQTDLGRLGFVLAAIVVMAIAINIVLFSGTTGGPFELLMMAGEDRGIPRIATRYALDIAVLAAGLALGGTFGIATVIYALMMGLVLQAVSQAFADYTSGRTHRTAVRQRSMT